MGIEVDNYRLPACWPTINWTWWLDILTAHNSARFRVLPDRSLLLDYQTSVQAALLVSRWSEVIVCKHGAKRAVFQIVVENIVGKPTLDGGLRAGCSEERVRLRFRTRERSVARIPEVFADAIILFANSVNAFDYFVGTKRSVFVIEAV